MKITIINQHTFNHGDDAAGIALILQIKKMYPTSEINIIYNNFGVTTGLPIKDSLVNHLTELVITKKNLWEGLLYLMSKVFKISILKKGVIFDTVQVISASDLIIISPSGANIGIYRDWKYLFRALVAVLEKKKTIFHLNTIGRSGNIIFDLIANYVLKRSEVFVRERKSLNYLKKKGINAIQGVDTAFSLPRVSIEENKEYLNSEYIAVIPSRFDDWHKDYKKNKIDNRIKDILLPGLAKYSLKKKIGIVLLPHTYGYLNEDNLLNDYRNYLITLGLDPNNVIIAKNINTFIDYERVIINSKLVISMRYHGIVFSVKNSIPFISLSYENKMSEVCAYSGMRDYDIKIKELNQTILDEKLLLVDENATEIHEKLSALTPILDSLARIPMEQVYLSLKYNN